MQWVELVFIIGALL